MSFFGLFGNKEPRAADALPAHPVSDGGVHTQPISPAGDRKSVRLSQRELLYNTVRDVMIRAGVLVASYRFKVLSLDSQGRQYLIMMDLLKVDMGDMKRLREIESMILQTAKVRHDLVVKGVYWRNELEMASAEVPQTSGAVGKPNPILRDFNAIPAARGIQRSEVEPLKHKGVGVIVEKPSPSAVVPTPKSKRPLPPGFEDTRIIEQPDYGSPLSATQYGELQ